MCSSRAASILYGPETLGQVADNSRRIVDALNKDAGLPAPLACKPVVTTAGEIERVCLEAGNDPRCIGLVCWMHTFSPAKMWIAGLQALTKPMAHLHTQFNRGIPWGEIDMDFMNLNQSAHGDREFGFMASRLRLARKVVVGHWRDADVHGELDAWMRAALAWADMRGGRIAPLRGQHARRGRDRGATRSRPRCGSVTRCTASGSATWRIA